ncbi:MAG: lytic murein transglycosylase, partial [Bifidobacteriaceae bacterium]|nr:lytic murein transglycosylase [Bifidobacteriaceae bacterium]
SGKEVLRVAELADGDWIARTAAAHAIPERALAAYAGAALAVGESAPGCRLGWNTLAAIGLVESEHGAFGGARLAADGLVAPPILGAALSGGATARVADTDQGAWDGDARWDRALGPMQILPATWAAHARDGNGDGRADPHQFDDAALTAAAYLCSGGGDLGVEADWIAAVGAYNPGSDYNNRVAEAASAYHQP